MRHLIFIALACVFVLAACGGNRTLESVPRVQSLGELLSELEELPAPDGVNPVDWQELKTSLATALRDSGKTKFAAAIPPPHKSNVDDLAVTGDTTLATFVWTYKNVADYDQNGEVNVSDLTPLGANLMKDPSSPDWNRARLADGDSNGEVNISDITPIGANLKNSVNGYKLQYSVDGSEAGTWTEAWSYTTAEGELPDGGGQKFFELAFADGQEGFYRVVPYSGEQLGTPSNVVQVLAAGGNPVPGVWPNEGGGSGLTSSSPLNGPGSANFRTRVYSANRFTDPTVGPDNMLVTGGDDGKVSKVDADGFLVWVYETGSSSPEIELLPDGTVYGLSIEGRLFCLNNADGVPIWEVETGVQGGKFGLFPDGRTVVLGRDYMVHSYDPNGGEEWTYSTGLPLFLPVAAPNGQTYLEQAEGKDGSLTNHLVIALDAAGGVIWDEDPLTTYRLDQLLASPIDSRMIYFDSWAADVGAVTRAAADGTVLWDWPEGTALWVSVDPLNGDMWIGHDGAGSSESLLNFDYTGTELGYYTATGYGQLSPVRFGLDGSYWWDDDDGEWHVRHPNGDSTHKPFPAGIYPLIPKGHGDLVGNLYLGYGAITKYDYTLEPLWTIGDADTGVSGPVFRSDGGYYVTFSGLTCYSAAHGSQWTHVGQLRVTGSPAIGLDGTVFYSTFKLFGGQETYLYAVNPDGTEKWVEHRPGARFSAPNIGSDGRVYVQADLGAGAGAVLGFDPLDGSEVFNAPTDGGGTAVPAINQTPGGDEIYALTYSNSTVHKFAADGSEEWSYDFDIYTVIANIVVTPDGTARFNSSGGFYAVKGDGTDLFPQISDGALSGEGSRVSVAPDGTAYYRVDESLIDVYELRAINPDGSPKWALEIASTVPVIDAEGKLYCHDNERLFCLDNDGNELWTVPMAAPAHSTRPVIGPGGKVYLYQNNGEMLIVSP